jgi:hypothetical protein
MLDKGRVDRLEQHMGREHAEEYRRFREGRYRSFGESVEKERALTVRRGFRKPAWDLFGKRL